MPLNESVHFPSFDRWCQQSIQTRVQKPADLVGLNELNIYISFDFNINGLTGKTLLA